MTLTGLLPAGPVRLRKGAMTAASSWPTRWNSPAVSHRSALVNTAASRHSSGSAWPAAVNSTAMARVVSMCAATTAAAAEAAAGAEMSRSAWIWRPVARHGRSRRSGLGGAVSASPYRCRSLRWYAVALGLRPVNCAHWVAVNSWPAARASMMASRAGCARARILRGSWTRWAAASCGDRSWSWLSDIDHRVPARRGDVNQLLFSECLTLAPGRSNRPITPAGRMVSASDDEVARSAPTRRLQLGGGRSYAGVLP